MSDTEYLQSSEANAERLKRSIEQHKASARNMHPSEIPGLIIDSETGEEFIVIDSASHNQDQHDLAALKAENERLKGVIESAANQLGSCKVSDAQLTLLREVKS